MDGVLLAEHLLKIINERGDRVKEIIVRGSIKNMEEDFLIFIRECFIYKMFLILNGFLYIAETQMNIPQGV